MGIERPEWTRQVYPQPLLNFIQAYFDLAYLNKDILRIGGGIYLNIYFWNIHFTIDHDILKDNFVYLLFHIEKLLLTHMKSNIDDFLYFFNKIGVPEYSLTVLPQSHKTTILTIFQKNNCVHFGNNPSSD